MGLNLGGFVKDIGKSAYKFTQGPVNVFSASDFLSKNPHFGSGDWSPFESFGPGQLVPESFKSQKAPGLGKAPGGPNRASATAYANNQISQDMQRRQASQTLFTSGQGLMDTPLIASAILLGS